MSQITAAAAAVESPRAKRDRLGLAALLLGMGVLHFAVPKPFEKLIPAWLGNERFWVYTSGACELTSGALLLAPRTSRAGGYAAAGTIALVFTGNIKMAADNGFPPRTPMGVAAYLRLPLQFPLLARALRIARQQPTES